ncbi:MAG: bacteriohemerythrin [Mariprofundaceae bacterium]|nr:bacteriohemerythrin [Mariprofundaceae bacterium]
MMQEEIFPWNTNFEIGIAMIDEQHQKLVHLVNKVANHFILFSEPNMIHDVLNELSDYTIYHFQSEEKIWDEFLPEESETIQHQHAHQNFIDRIMNFREKDLLSNEKISHELLTFLTHWLSFHILDEDRYMGNIVLAIQDGNNLEKAKAIAQHKANHSTQLLLSTVLTMYDSLSSKTLKLMREISKRKQAEERSRVLQSAIDASLEGMFITDNHGMLIDANPAFCKHIHRTWNQLSACNIRQLSPPIFEQKSIEKAWQYTDKYGHWAGEIRATNSLGIQESFWLSLSSLMNKYGMITHYSGVLSSATALIKQKDMLEVEVNYDALTRLPNRRLFHERLKQAISRGERNSTPFAVCFLDLDGFKDVNDSYGHDVGDILLCTVSRQIEQAIRKTDSVARIGGDEFAILLESLNDKSDVTSILQKVLQSIQEPIFIASHRVNISASMGIAMYPDDSSIPKCLLKKADQAMYMGKHAGKSRIIYYHQEDIICEK